MTFYGFLMRKSNNLIKKNAPKGALILLQFANIIVASF